MLLFLVIIGLVNAFNFNKIPPKLNSKTKACVIGLVADPERLADIRRNRVAIMNEHQIKDYTNLDSIKKEVNDSKNLFKKNLAKGQIVTVTELTVSGCQKQTSERQIVRELKVFKNTFLPPKCRQVQTQLRQLPNP